MDTWIMWIVGVSVAYWIGHAIGGHMKAYQIMENLLRDPEGMKALIDKLKLINDAETLEDVNVPENAIPLEIEKVNGYIYAYNKLTGEFLSQAHDIEQAARIARQRFPGKTFWHPELKKDTQTA